MKPWIARLRERYARVRLRQSGLAKWLTTVELRYYVDGPGSARFAMQLAKLRRSQHRRAGRLRRRLHRFTRLFHREDA